MDVFGITGSVGVGKSTVANFFRSFHFPVFDADEAVRKLYQCPEIIDQIKQVFPDAVDQNSINKQKLAACVVGDHDALDRLEAILHPPIRHQEINFISRCYYRRQPVCALDIPLLFETGAHRIMDHVITVWVPDHIQRQRVINRPHMDDKKLQFIRQRQLPQVVKKHAADFTILSGLGRRNAYHQFMNIMNEVSLFHA